MKKELLNEELYRIKYLFNHQRGVIVSEQVDLVGDTKSIRVNTPIGGGGISYKRGKESERALPTNTASFVYRNKNAPGEFLDKQVDKMLENSDIVIRTLSDKEQISLWEEIKQNDKYFAADVVRYVQRRGDVKQTILSKKGEEEKVPPIKEPVPDDEKKYPSIDIATPKNIDTTKYFDDNKWVLSEIGRQDIEQNFINPVLKIMEGNENTGKAKRGCINYINVDTSSSRFRNTGDASKMTFLQLSQLRNQATYQYIIDRFKSVGVTEWCNTEGLGNRNYLGENGDGTSGPNPPFKDKDGKIYFYVPKGRTSAEAVTDNKTARNEFGQPLQDKSEYENFKYNRIGLGVAFDFEKEIEPIYEPGDSKNIEGSVANSDEYFAKFIIKSKDKLKWDWDWKLKLRLPSLPSGRPSKSSPVSCPKWGKPRVGGKIINF